MSEIIDIIHRLSYEADTDVIQAVNKEFGTQLKQLQDLKNKEAEYSALLDKTGKQDINRRKVIEGLLNKTKQQYDAIAVSVGKQAASNDKLNASLVKTGKNLSSLSFAGSQLLREAPAFTYSIQTGILALSNNIPILLDQLTQARASGATTTEIFKSLGNSIFGLTGLITIAVSALTIFGGQLFDSGDEAKKSEDKVKSLTSALDEYLKKLDEVYKINRSNQFGLTIGGLSEAQLKRELEILKARGASADEIAAKENQISAIRQKSLSYQQSELKAALDYVKQVKEAQLSGEAIPTAPAISRELRKVIKELKPEDAEREIRNRFDAVSDRILNEQNSRRADALEREGEAAKTAAEKLKKYNEINAEIMKMAREINSLSQQDFEEYGKRLADELKQREAALDDYMKVIQRLVTADILEAVTGSATPEAFDAKAFRLEVELRTQQRDKELQKKEEERKKKVEEKNKEAIKDNLNYAYNTTIQTLQAIYEAQLYYLDKELEIRRDRVAQATELAEKGNTEILEAEKNRLQETEAERERVAQRQLQLDALLRASSAAIAATQAIQTITNAGATGDPYTIPLRIAAAVAALAAGFAFVQSLTTAFKFKDGVIGLQGEGTETSDSIPARLSKGESVMTAAETKKFRPYLEAMRDGSFYNMVTAERAIAPSTNYGRLEKKLDGVIAAVEGNKVNVSQRMDKSGLSQAVETYTRRERNRFR